MSFVKIDLDTGGAILYPRIMQTEKRAPVWTRLSKQEVAEIDAAALKRRASRGAFIAVAALAVARRINNRSATK